jgi:hypothetical protein
MKKKQPQPLTYSSMDEKSLIPTYKKSSMDEQIIKPN